eukprot:1145327-Pelagomonas_calceolata.AAC.7
MLDLLTPGGMGWTTHFAQGAVYLLVSWHGLMHSAQGCWGTADRDVLLLCRPLPAPPLLPSCCADSGRGAQTGHAVGMMQGERCCRVVPSRGAQAVWAPSRSRRGGRREVPAEFQLSAVRWLSGQMMSYCARVRWAGGRGRREVAVAAVGLCGGSGARGEAGQRGAGGGFGGVYGE